MSVYKGKVQDTVLESPSGLVREQEATRPLGVSVLAGLNMFGALLMVVGAFGLGLSAGEPGAAWALGLLGLGQFLVARGLWRLRNWARLIAVGCYGLSSTLGLLSLFTGQPLGLVQTLVAGSIVHYLTRAHVVRAFTTG